MKFQDGKSALIELIATQATAGKYNVVGSRMQSHSAEEIAKLAHVEVVYESGEFPKSRGSMSGICAHDVTLKVVLIVASGAEVDLAVLNSPTATDVQRAAALAAALTAADKADARWDALADRLWNLIMSPLNIMLGQTDIMITNRWMQRFVKNDVGKLGSYSLITGTADVTFTVEERATGVIPVPGEAIETTVELTADQSGDKLDIALQGVKVGT